MGYLEDLEGDNFIVEVLESDVTFASPSIDKSKAVTIAFDLKLAEKYGNGNYTHNF